MNTYKRISIVIAIFTITVAIVGCSQGSDAVPTPVPIALPYDCCPSWSPDGNQLVFTSNRDGNSEVYVANQDGTGQINITNNSAEDGSPAWSPNGDKIAFVSLRDGNNEIYVMNSDGSGQANITNDSAIDGPPAWSPDGSRIAFISGRQESYEDPADRVVKTKIVDDIVVVSADGSSRVKLSESPGGVDDASARPAWSPDGNTIAFSSDLDSDVVRNVEIYLIGADGNGLVRFTNHPSQDYYPVFSPDGGKLSWTSRRWGGDDIFVKKVSEASREVLEKDNGNATRVTINVSDDYAHVWSKDGGQLFFMTQRDGIPPEIFVTKADKGPPKTSITGDSDVFDGHMSLSPDGEWIAFISNRTGNDDVFVMRTDGSEVTNISNNEASDGNTAWSVGEAFGPAGKRGRYPTCFERRC